MKDIDRYSEQNIPEQSSKRLQSLSHFYEEFYKQLNDLGFSTRSSRYREVSKNINEAGLNNYKQIIFAGFFALTQSEKEIFNRHRDHGKFL